MKPTRIGQYEILDILGRGGSAVVYRARHSFHNMEVAIKVMQRHHLQNDRLRVRFSREAQTIRDLSYPTIVPLIDYGEFGTDRLPFLVMKYMPRGSLKERLEDGPLPVNEVVKVMQRIGRALDYAHSRGVIHRDIKPGNILYDEDDHPHLADFGIAVEEDVNATAITGQKQTVGTPAYMSPEQGMGDKVDRRSDIYALGVVLFEMLTGERPYGGDTPATPLAVMLMHVQSPIPDILSVNPRLPAGIKNVIIKALAKQKEERFNSAEEMVLALKQATRESVESPALPAPTQQNIGQAATIVASESVVMPQQTATTTTDPVVVASPPRRRGRWLWLSIPVVLLGLFACVAGAAVVYWQFGDQLLAQLTPAATASVAPTEAVTEGEPTPSPTTAAGSTMAAATAAVLDAATTEAEESVAATATTDNPALRPTLRATSTIIVVETELSETMTLRNYRCDEVIASFRPADSILFEWEWPDELEEGEYLEIRAGPAGSAQLSIVGGRVEESLRDGEVWRWPLVADGFYVSGTQSYEWQVFHMSADQSPLGSSPRGCVDVTP